MVNGLKLRAKKLKGLWVIRKLLRKRLLLEEYMRKASLEYPDDGIKFLDLHEKYVQLFKNPISFNVDGNEDNDGDDNGDDDADDGDGNGDNDGDDDADDDADDGDGIGDNDRDDDADDGDGNGDDEDGNLDDDGDRNGDGEDDKNPSGSNPSFGFSKISLEDVDKQPSGSVNSPKNQVVEKESIDPTVQEIVVEGMPTEEYEIMSTPESYTQWLERNTNLVREIIDCKTDEYLYGDLFGQNLVTTEVLNQGPLTPDRMPTRASKVSHTPEKRIVKPSSYMLSPYMNKKTKVFPKLQGWSLLLETVCSLCRVTRFKIYVLMVMMTNEEASQIKLRLSLKAMKVVWLSKALTWCSFQFAITVIFMLSSSALPIQLQ
ncbi:hypothetical protein Tco_0887613 [Tanacetum coccineum]